MNLSLRRSELYELASDFATKNHKLARSIYYATPEAIYDAEQMGLSSLWKYYRRDLTQWVDAIRHTSCSFLSKLSVVFGSVSQGDQNAIGRPASISIAFSRVLEAEELGAELFQEGTKGYG